MFVLALKPHYCKTDVMLRLIKRKLKYEALNKRIKKKRDGNK
jgi:hypothetical protein